MQNKLFVGNLAGDVTENDLQDLFAQHGSVNDVNLVIDRATRQSRGFAFVTMATDEAAQTAKQALNGSNFHNQTLKIDVARPREEGSGGRRPGGGGGGG